MTHMKTKLIVASVVLVGALAYLGLAGVKKGWVYYLAVDDYIAGAQYHAQRVRLMGKVAPEGLVTSPAQLTASFDLAGQTQRIKVVYRGVIPEMFQAGGDVVVEGRQDAAGVFQADVLMTKCASKYDPETHKMRSEAEATK